MNFRLLAAVWLLAGPVMSATAQTSADPNEGTQFSLNNATGNYTFSWWGVAGRTYFLQQSGDLLNVVVTWTSNSDNAATFIIERSTYGNGWQQIGSCPATVTRYTDTTAEPDRVHQYRVSAAN